MKTKKIRLRDVLRSYIKVGMKYPWLNGVILLSFLLAKMFMNLGIPYITGSLVDAIESGVAKTFSDLVPILWMFLGISIAYNVFHFIPGLLLPWYQTRVLKTLTDETFQQLQKKSYGFFAGQFTGSLVAQIRRYVTGFEILYDNFIFSYWNVSTQVIAILALLGFSYPMLSLAFCVWIVGFVTVAYWFSVWKSRRDKIAATADSKVTGIVADTIGNILAVKSFGKRNEEIGRLVAATDHQQKVTQSAWLMGTYQRRAQGVLVAIMQTAMLAMMAWYWSEGFMSVGDVVMVQGWMLGLSMSIWDIGRAMQTTGKYLSYGVEMQEILHNGNEIIESENSQPANIKNGALSFQNISFVYEQGQEAVFKDFNLEIQPGEKVGLVGKSGAGKSTITKMLLRFVDPKSGTVMVDNQDIRSVGLDDLRQHMTYVPQEPVLFHRSLSDNIRYGAPDATDKEVQEAAKMAHADEFIRDLPNGYDTLVGERGIKLSGGQRQRIAIARAMLKKAPILILDEATSSLDSVSEKFIQESLHTLMEKRTTLVIAHRLSTLQEMDRIVVLEKGTIVEEGTHEELLKKKGVYEELWKHQAI